MWPDLNPRLCQTLTSASRAAASLRFATALALRSLTLASTLDPDSGPGDRSNKEAIQEYRFPKEAHALSVFLRFGPSQVGAGIHRLEQVAPGVSELDCLARRPRTLCRYSFSRKSVTAWSKAAG
jgi:hypothetical protein